MSRERFEWLKSVAGEIITTPGGESNVKEIFDKTWELKRTREDVVDSQVQTFLTRVAWLRRVWQYRLLPLLRLRALEIQNQVLSGQS